MISGNALPTDHAAEIADAVHQARLEAVNQTLAFLLRPSAIETGRRALLLAFMTRHAAGPPRLEALALACQWSRQWTRIRLDGLSLQIAAFQSKTRHSSHAEFPSAPRVKT